MNSSEIKIGYPTNTRMAKDILSVSELLELSGEQEVLRSRFVPGAVFRPLRVTDIARFLRLGVFQLGIIGDDTACEEGLEIQGFSSEILTQLDRVCSEVGPVAKLEPYLFYPLNRRVRLRLGDPTYMTLFACPDIKEKMFSPSEILSAGKIATSYPNLAEKALRISNKMNPVSVETFDGKIESIVANRDDGSVVGGFDLVRTGDTLNEFGLVRYGSVMESNPGIWQTPSLITDLSMRNKVSDILDVLRELLRDFVF